MVARHGQSDCRIFLDQPIRARIFFALRIDSLFTFFTQYVAMPFYELWNVWINNELFHEEKCITIIKPFEILNLYVNLYNY